MHCQKNIIIILLGVYFPYYGDTRSQFDSLTTFWSVNLSLKSRTVWLKPGLYLVVTKKKWC